MPTDRNPRIRAWSLIVAGQNINRGSILTYDENPATDYTWTNRVPNHAALHIGDIVVLRSKKQVLGISLIETILSGPSILTVFTCPYCTSSNFKFRTTKTPPYLCYACRTSFEKPTENSENGTKFYSNHEKHWIALKDFIPLTALRECLTKTKSQHSISELNWEAFLNRVSGELEASTLDKIAKLELLQQEIQPHH